MRLQTAQDLLYINRASANSEATDWNPAYTGAHRLLFFVRFFCVRNSPLYGRTVWGAERLAGYLYAGIPNHTARPPLLELWSAGLSNLLTGDYRYA